MPDSSISLEGGLVVCKKHVPIIRQFLLCVEAQTGKIYGGLHSGVLHDYLKSIGCGIVGGKKTTQAVKLCRFPSLEIGTFKH